MCSSRWRPDAARLADQYFFETLVRIRRAGEGAPCAGLKDEPVDAVIQKLKAHMEVVVREKFVAVEEAAKQKDRSVEPGHKYVEAYVPYMHYVEGLHESVLDRPAGTIPSRRSHGRNPVRRDS